MLPTSIRNPKELVTNKLQLNIEARYRFKGFLEKSRAQRKTTSFPLWAFSSFSSILNPNPYQPETLFFTAGNAMGATVSTAASPLARQTLISPVSASQTQIRCFARWVPYKPQSKPKLHQKLRTIKTLKSQLENCYLISPFACHGFSCNQFKAVKQPLRSDPSASKLIVAKNSLVSKAFAGTPWEALAPCMKGMNALLFVKKEEVVGSAMSGVKNVVKEGKLEFNEFSGAVMDGKLYGHLDLEVLETIPGKLESDGMVLGSLYSPASSLMALLQGFGDDDGNKETESQCTETEAKAS